MLFKPHHQFSLIKFISNRIKHYPCLVNVFPIIKRELNNFVTIAQSKGQKTKIIQFASNIHENNGSRLVIKRGNTNLYKALLYSQKQIRTGRNNIFFITDGAHNMQPSLNDLCTE